MSIAAADITAVVLAGGQGRRMDGVDKGLVLLDGAPLVEHVVARIAPQVGAIVVNANRNAERYRALGYDVVADALPGYAGPLAGIAAALAVAQTPYVLSVPCDTPGLPDDLVPRLAHALDLHDSAIIAVARTGAQLQPVVALMQRAVGPALATFLAGGGRKVDAWHATLPAVHVDFADEADAFTNLNTRADVAASAAHARRSR
ncbi:MAG: molybdenum cofactor guanylyltransferase [Proteobacteria bacterium]|nr:molybdenum cofactor guanylyltransferase [Pseudomonadota bacterium]